SLARSPGRGSPWAPWLPEVVTDELPVPTAAPPGAPIRGPGASRDPGHLRRAVDRRGAAGGALRPGRHAHRRPFQLALRGPRREAGHARLAEGDPPRPPG